MEFSWKINDFLFISPQRTQIVHFIASEILHRGDNSLWKQKSPPGAGGEKDYSRDCLRSLPEVW